MNPKVSSAITGDQGLPTTLITQPRHIQMYTTSQCAPYMLDNHVLLLNFYCKLPHSLRSLQGCVEGQLFTRDSLVTSRALLPLTSPVSRARALFSEPTVSSQNITLARTALDVIVAHHKLTT